MQLHLEHVDGWAADLVLPYRLEAEGNIDYGSWEVTATQPRILIAEG
jgi:hypothetical protein